MKKKRLIFMIIVSFCVSFCTLIGFCTQAVAMSPENIVEKARFLEKQGEHKTARTFLMNEYFKSGNMVILRKWIELDKELFDVLRNSNNYFSIQPWIPYKHSANESKTEKAVRWAIFLTPVRSGQTEYDRRKEVEYESSHPIETLAESQIEKTLDTYKILKQSYLEMMRVLDQLIAKTGLADLKETIEIKRAQKEFFEEVAQRRSQFISYDVISPSLNRTKQLIFLSEHDKIFSIGHSMDYLRQAVKFMGKGAGDQQLILQAEPDVRREFVEVYKLLKETAGAAEFEELKFFAKLQDKIGEKRSVGYQRWMEN